MNSRYLKSAIVTSGLAVFVGVLSFGINLATGAPTANPPGTGVAPTFTGVDVTGDINLGGGITSDAGVVVIPAPNGLRLGAGLEVFGNIQNSIGAGNDPVRINDSLTIQGAISDPDSALSISDDVTISGAISNASGVLNLNDDVTISGNFSTPGTGAFTINDNLDIDGAISDRNSDLVIGDNLTITGTATINGAVSDSDSALTVSDDLSVSGNVSDPDSAVTVSDDFSVTGAMSVTGNITDPNSGVTISDDFVIYGPTYAIGNVYTSTDVAVGGHLAAATIGGYTTVTPSYTTMSAGSTFSVTASCPISYRLVSCGYEFAADYANTVYVNRVFPDMTNNLCSVRFRNTSAASVQGRPIATCFNSSL